MGWDSMEYGLDPSSDRRGWGSYTGDRSSRAKSYDFPVIGK